VWSFRSRIFSRWKADKGMLGLEICYKIMEPYRHDKTHFNQCKKVVNEWLSSGTSVRHLE